MRLTLKALLFLLPFLVQAQYSASVETVLKKAGNNRVELEKALEYANKTGDTLKIKAMQFLVSNMDIHSSSNYYWEDAAGKKIVYNELDYPDFEQAKTAFEIIKIQNPGLKPKPVTYQDIETLTGDYLIQNLEKAFQAWQTSTMKNIAFADFCEYILPYRVSVEPLQDWRTVYAEKFKWISEQIPSKGFKQVLFYVKGDYDTWFTNTWGEASKEPLPRLSALQLLFRKQGPCPDIADLGVFVMRSQGIPAAVNVIPYWATATGGHFMNTFFDDTMTSYNCDYGSKDFGENLKREPAKVLRLTYSKHPETLASFEDKNNIPTAFLKQENYIDVTEDYWETTDVKCSLYPTTTPTKIVYATTFNGLSWRPFWWGKVENGKTIFSSICKGTVLIPQYYSNGKLVPAGAPIVVGDKEPKVLLPDLTQTRDVTITEADKYLRFKLGVTYKLFYWDNGWKLVDTREVSSPITSMLFTKVPKNALLLFLASDSKKLERPFIMDDNGERTWY
ncbi:MAG: transglutaminase domain-containing protein [Bacteroidota bacterium]